MKSVRTRQLALALAAATVVATLGVVAAPSASATGGSGVSNFPTVRSGQTPGGGSGVGTVRTVAPN